MITHALKRESKDCYSRHLARRGNSINKGRETGFFCHPHTSWGLREIDRPLTVPGHLTRTQKHILHHKNDGLFVSIAISVNLGGVCERFNNMQS